MTTREVICPQCKKPTEYSAKNPFRPFCSDRCKLIDLGDWADGKHAIPAENLVTADSENESETDDSDND
jgi:endogenous inhibitor of DNA gyrase (YacG/DUF329 family)